LIKKNSFRDKRACGCPSRAGSAQARGPS